MRLVARTCRQQQRRGRPGNGALRAQRRNGFVLLLVSLSLLPCALTFLFLAPFKHHAQGDQLQKNNPAAHSIATSIGRGGAIASTSSTSTSLRAIATPFLLAVTAMANQYNSWLTHYPLLTHCMTASSLSGLGDVIAQLSYWQFQQLEQISVSFKESDFQLDRERLGRFMLKGLGGGMIWAFWFDVNEQWTNQLMQYPFSNAGGTSTGTLTEWLASLGGDSAVMLGKTVTALLLEQFVGAPIIFAFWEIPVPTLLSPAKDNSSIPRQVQEKLPVLLVDNAKIWTFANMFVYSAPLEYRVLISSLVDILWQSIVSAHVMTTHGDAAAETVLADDIGIAGNGGDEEDTACFGVDLA
ncbi:expressed unknown protein [Seminavis robusta]|uniref:Uncharacterized protein n=1 Tax=Seminavis robusta TaxID=568900 RepID=A0A9N8EE55_9STRA|nr:expressed unknown protein [Seminavis robusta]|eukprot:Sro960_g224900.1 n/a (354) ;mRNA; r:33546-34607